MRAVWATVLATWALFAVLAVLVWTRPQPVAAAQTVPQAVVVTKNGKSSLVVVKASASTTHATTRTSPVGAG